MHSARKATGSEQRNSQGRRSTTGRSVSLVSTGLSDTLSAMCVIYTLPFLAGSFAAGERLAVQVADQRPFHPARLQLGRATTAAEAVTLAAKLAGLLYGPALGCCHV